MLSPMECRVGCGACCIAPSISSPIPGMPAGKPAGVRCIHLSDENRCKIYNDPGRPPVCESFQASYDVCGDSYQQAIDKLAWLEKQTEA